MILRGDTFGIGDRITLGGVRGDVIRLGFIKTTIMEMGQPPSVSSADPAVWVNSRQYTGRLVTVTVTNGVIFKEPVYAVVDDPTADQALATMRSRYAMADASLNPAVYWRITDNWLELSLRFLAPCRGVREVKDRISRDVLGQLDAAGVASATYDIVGLPTVQLTTPPSG